MIIHQFEDKGLAHFSYLILSEVDRKAVVIDPARDAQPYLNFLSPYGGELVAIIETHPHADFVSSHAELSKRTGAPILVSSAVGVAYTFQPFNEGDELAVAEFTLKALETPGHSPDSISVLLFEGDKPTALFSGDTLFVGDVGRPDLREKAGAINLSRQDLARMMYNTIQTKLLPLPDDVVVYPAHGAGSLCGKALSNAVSTTIGEQRFSNPSLQPMDEDSFVERLLADQPFIPKYFGAAVEMNRVGAPNLQEALASISFSNSIVGLPPAVLVIDTRSGDAFKSGHLPSALNIQVGAKFDTWLGSIIAPGESFILVAEDEATAKYLITRAAAIGYEGQVQQVVVQKTVGNTIEPKTDVEAFRADPDTYTIVDVRNRGEQSTGLIFSKAIAIPLPELRERWQEIPQDKPIMVHCAAGYRSAAGQSILSANISQVPVYDLGEAIKTFVPVNA
jgi:glyoxylase-like metal-dependent hydrolase (beta-lactamase superfamily II)/rhodanese-related sulfurtransferase